MNSLSIPKLLCTLSIANYPLSFDFSIIYFYLIKKGQILIFLIYKQAQIPQISINVSIKWTNGTFIIDIKAKIKRFSIICSFVKLI